MLRAIHLAIVLFYVGHVCSSPQVVLQSSSSAIKPRKLHGRFLQISDMHPDAYYSSDTTLNSACHRQARKRKKKNRAGYYGIPFSKKCDSPFRLTNFTLDYLEKKWSSEVDFVIWTGDNARHDKDHKIPRTPNEIYELNRAMAAKIKSIFLDKGIPVVPSLGNNDVWPHNIMEPGPNSITNEFTSIWVSFIPFPQRQVFERGAYFSVEVIPNSLAVVSLNTMYFYRSNKAVRGCLFKEPEDPGNLQLDWLEVQLKQYRSRNIQVWLSGHVPPSPGNYHPECYVRYAELSLRFQDTIVGHAYGHMNVDHFTFVEAIDLEIISEEKKDEGEGEDENEATLYEQLLQEYSVLYDKGDKIDFDNYSIINTSPSVVPNPYTTTFRIFVYNTTEEKDKNTKQMDQKKKKKGGKRRHGHRRGDHGDKRALCGTEPHKSSWKCHLDAPWHSDSDSPSRKNRRWSPLGFAQYWVPRLDAADERHEPRFKLHYTTFPLELLRPSCTSCDGQPFYYPIPAHNLPRSLKDPNITLSKYTPYGLKDLTIPSWVTLAQRMGNVDNKRLRKRFRRYMYMGGVEE